MSGQISSRRRHLSTKQWSGNKCSDVPTKIQTSSYAMDHRYWPCKQRLALHQSCHCTRLQRFLQTVKHFWRLILSIFCFWNESFLFQNRTLLCQQNRIFVDMLYFLKNCCSVAKACVNDSTSELTLYDGISVLEGNARRPMIFWTSANCSPSRELKYFLACLTASMRRLDLISSMNSWVRRLNSSVLCIKHNELTQILLLNYVWQNIHEINKTYAKKNERLIFIAPLPVTQGSTITYVCSGPFGLVT